MNLVGHVAVAARFSGDATPGFLAGAMLPDLGAIARVRLLPRADDDTRGTEAARDVADGIALHHASDAVFHASRWFHEHNRGLRDLLLEAGVDRGAARACAHAGLEMLLDGDLVADAAVADSTDAAFDALVTAGPTRDAAAALVASRDRDVWIDRLDRIGRSLDTRAYSSASNVATRLYRMTQGRARIELHDEHITEVTLALEAYRPVVQRDGARVVDDVLAGVSRTAAEVDDPSTPVQGVDAGRP